MKYIRTKGRIYKADSVTIKIVNELLYNYEEILYHTEEKILKQANTIEELCDEFLIYDKDQNDGLPIICPKERLDEIKPYIQICMQTHFDVWLKGAIYTDKGLIYVAIMNEKGELKLL